MITSTRRPWLWLLAIGIVGFLGIAMRVSNVFTYPIDMGFDATGNWDYIARIIKSWALPAPDSGWATAHPPFFYYLAGLIGRVFGEADKTDAVHAIRLVMSSFGLIGIWLAVSLVRRTDPENWRRAFFAAAILLFLPVHIYMSAMLSEEILVASLVSFAVVGVAIDSLSSAERDRALLRAAGLGAVAGLALLTKLTGLLIVAAGAAAYLIQGLRAGEKMGAFGRSLVFGGVGLLVGGWFYVWNLFAYGYLYPHGLEVHTVMFSMPPGERGWIDYLWIPWQLFLDPQLLSPRLLHSVWGSTYVTIWFDGHHHFVPARGEWIARSATAILVLGAIPTAAFVIGLIRGIRRSLRSQAGPDAVLVLLVAATIAGYILFTLQNPWFSVLKGSFLLGLSAPFAYYASEVLADWTREPRLRSFLVLASLGTLALFVIATFSYGVVFEKHELPGLQWSPVETSQER